MQEQKKSTPTVSATIQYEKQHNSMIFSFGLLALSEWLPLAPQKQVASMLFTALYSFMADFTDLIIRQVNLSVEHL